MVTLSEPALPAKQEQQHFLDLDGLRGVLALAVVLLHLGFNSFVERQFGWKGFRFELCVDVFFLLSGYVLTHAARRGVRPGVFFARRFLRLAPVFYVTTLVTMLATPNSWNPLELLMAMPFIGQDPTNFPAWSVSWEFFIPVVAVLVPLRLPDRAVRPLLLIALIALGIADFSMTGGERLYFVRAVCGLLAGHLLYRAKLSLALPLLPLFVALGLVMALAAYFPAPAFALPFVAAMCVLSGRNGGSIFAGAPFQFLGVLSYTIYLAHIPVLRLLQQGVGPAIDANPLAKMAALAGTFAFAWLLTTLVERPAMRIGSSIGRQSGTTSPLGEAGGRA